MKPPLYIVDDGRHDEIRIADSMKKVVCSLPNEERELATAIVRKYRRWWTSRGKEEWPS